MFTCRSCMRRLLCTLSRDPTSYALGLATATHAKYIPLFAYRGYRTIAQPKDRHQKAWGRNGSDSENLGKLSSPDDARRNLINTGKTTGRVFRQAEIEKHLTYLVDPLKLANHVLDLLSQDKFNEAKILVCAASKSFSCTVSWNHLINWLLSQGKVKLAIGTYNEMKKRAQKPDGHTYTILFRGLAEYSHHPQALSKALSIYHSMDAENSPVKPNVIHTNAILKVCARAKDMDALYGIVAKLQRKGVRAPNNLTYTTILNAIYQRVDEASSGNLDASEYRGIYQKAIVEARKLWIEITERWLQGDIWIDEETTCSMGRILLKGDTQDVDDVFSLVEQTMKIPRFVPKIGTDIKNQLVPKLGTSVDNQMDSTFHKGGEILSREGQSSPIKDSTQEILPHDEFEIVAQSDRSMKRSDGYAKPGRNSLSLVLEALKDVRLSRPLAEYWNYFTNVCRVVPDSNNFHTYLQNLRIRRASSDAVNLLQQMPKEMLRPKTFRLAMSTCARDKNNPNSFANAGKVLDIMQQNLSDLDLAALHKYMEVALHGAMDLADVPNGSSEMALAQGRRILRALERLGPCITTVRSSLAYNERPYTQYVSKSESVPDHAAAVALVREMISAYDKLINHGMVPQEMNRHLKRERNRLATFVTRYTPGARKPLSTDKEGEKQESPPEHVPSIHKRVPEGRMPPKVTVNREEPTELIAVA